MAKPPSTPPSSDIDGVRQDQHRVDTPENATPDPGRQLQRGADENKARPAGTDQRKGA